MEPFFVNFTELFDRDIDELAIVGAFQLNATIGGAYEIGLDLVRAGRI